MAKAKQQLGKKFRDRRTKASPKSGGKLQAAVVLGKRGGKKGGPARAKALAPSKRSAIAKQGAKARWAKV